MDDFSPEADRISWAVTATPLHWRQSGYPQPTAHNQHIYDAGCAICKAGHAPWALRIVIDAILAEHAQIDGSERG